jgi:isopentenyldiphosphate isomerase
VGATRHPQDPPHPSDPAEVFDLFDAHDYRVVGRATRGECHGNPALIHAVARIHVRDAAGRFLLQLRSATKDIQPNKWDTSVGGHLHPGEEPATAARREMREELGVEPDELTFLHRFLWRSPVESEWVTTYTTVHPGPFQPDPAEVAALRFWTPADIRSALGTGVLTPAFEDEFQRLTGAQGGSPCPPA